jgi:hypothetical protein
VNETKPSRRLIKLAVGLVLLGALGLLFWRSVRGTRAQPYTLTPASLRAWSLTTITGARPNEPMLVWQPPPDLTSSLFGQLFKRSMESMGQPALPGIPLVFQAELARAQANHPTLTPAALMAAAREAGMDSAPPRPICLAHRRASGGSNDREQLYFVIFDAPAFGRFRQRFAELGNRAFAGGAAIDPGQVSPALILALIESSSDHWLPLHADPKVDCVAPIAMAAPAD